MGKDVAAVREAFHDRLGQMARELGRELYPDGLPRGTKFSELEALAGALGDEMGRQLIEVHVRGQAEDWPEQERGECPVCGGGGRPQGTGPAPGGHHHPGGRRLDPTRRELPPLSAGFFSLRTRRWALTARGSAPACNSRSCTPGSTARPTHKPPVTSPRCRT